ncbi:hypothetical protein LOTGIDRAFT_236275 [Lottia gigantea]|uniref:Uncharacterized protein n=1 Tax=Lottia gigantea TaxID=225164 RepID=V3Z1S8_LOTGI|nr:hypothetical protein LOTGIDRAFT_236275 [Lottia gigantea]ESO84498.1 hypothetical protein LOTGIDRAFT_236275 [Lottia gigantea]
MLVIITISLRHRWVTKLTLIMDIVSRLNKQNHRVALQARRLNNAAKQLLDKKMAKLEDKYERRFKALEKETECVLQELQDAPKTCRIPSACSSAAWDEDFQLPSFRDKQDSSKGWSGFKSEPVCTSCRYSSRKKKSECKYFPCHLPETYETLGFQSYPTPYTCLSNYEALSHRSCPVTSAATKSVTLLRNTNGSTTSRLTTKDKMRGLGVYIKGLRAKNEKKKPQAWEVRYGEPIPRRLLLKTAVPINNF